MRFNPAARFRRSRSADLASLQRALAAAVPRRMPFRSALQERQRVCRPLGSSPSSRLVASPLCRRAAAVTLYLPAAPLLCTGSGGELVLCAHCRWREREGGKGGWHGDDAARSRAVPATDVPDPRGVCVGSFSWPHPVPFPFVLVIARAERGKQHNARWLARLCLRPAVWWWRRRCCCVASRPAGDAGVGVVTAASRRLR